MADTTGTVVITLVTGIYSVVMNDGTLQATYVDTWREFLALSEWNSWLIATGCTEGYSEDFWMTYKWRVRWYNDLFWITMRIKYCGDKQVA